MKAHGEDTVKTIRTLFLFAPKSVHSERDAKKAVSELTGFTESHVSLVLYDLALAGLLYKPYASSFMLSEKGRKESDWYKVYQPFHAAKTAANARKKKLGL